MKQYFRITMLWLAVAMIAPMMTSCDEFFSLIDNPVTPALRVYTETLVVGEGHSLKINATTQDHVMLTYASSDPSVAIVDAEGNVIGVSEGKATITVTAQGDDYYYRNQIFGTNTHAVDVAVVKYDPTAIKLLADAQKEGALVSITFNLDGTDYIAYFRLVNGEYVLQDGPAAARAAAPAATRAPAAARGVTRTWHEDGKGGATLNPATFNNRVVLEGGVDFKLTKAPGSVDPEKDGLTGTWIELASGNAIGQVQIEGATGETTMVQVAAADVSGHAVEMKKIEVNDVTVCDSNIQTQADDGKAGENVATGGSGDSGGGGGGKSGGSGGGSTGGGSSIIATDYKFTETDVYMLVGDTKYLQYTYSPKNAYVRFSVSDKTLVEVNETTGLVKAKAAGIAKVTFFNSGFDKINADAGKVCKITVIDPKEIDPLFNHATSLYKITYEMISDNKINFLVGDIASTSEQISLKLAPFLAEKICKMNVLNKVVLFLGGDEIAGYDFCILDGSTKKFYTLNSDDAIPSEWENIKLYYVQKAVTSITLFKSTLDLVVGQADVTLNATVKPDDAADKTITWSSSNKAIATVDNGTVHAVAAGNATITAKAGDKTAECAVTVYADGATVTTAPKATTGTISANSATALVTAGVASGGTMMYAVTTTDTKPTTTAGFSATVPTAVGRNAGTYYVWYYVKGYATYADSAISGSAIEVTVN